ncbi:MAG TPA: transposase [Gemmatimonadales bacterium]|nr:transposase [Gemmatimonadales bacterium]
MFASPEQSATEPTVPRTPDAPPAGRSAPPSFDWHALVEPDLWDQVPADVDDLLRLLPWADLYVQDEVHLDLHPTLTRTWSRRGRRGQRRVRAPGQNRKLIGFGAIDWRTGWLSHGMGWRRDSAAICLQVEHLVERSRQRGRTVLLLWDNLGIHTRRGSKRLRAWLDEHPGQIRLIYTPAYDPEANPAERLWRVMRPNVTHNHHRDILAELYADARTYFDGLDAAPERVLAHIGSSFAPLPQAAAA